MRDLDWDGVKVRRQLVAMIRYDCEQKAAKRGLHTDHTRHGRQCKWQDGRQSGETVRRPIQPDLEKS